MIIKVFDATGEYCLTEQDGQKLFNIISDLLNKDTKILLDFERIKSFASPYLNVSIGQLFKDHKKDYVMSHIEFKNLSPLGTITLNRVVENAVKYYSDKKFKHDVDKNMFQDA